MRFQTVIVMQFIMQGRTLKERRTDPMTYVELRDAQSVRITEWVRDSDNTMKVVTEWSDALACFRFLRQVERAGLLAGYRFRTNHEA